MKGSTKQVVEALQHEVSMLKNEVSGLIIENTLLRERADNLKTITFGLRYGAFYDDTLRSRTVTLEEPSLP